MKGRMSEIALFMWRWMCKISSITHCMASIPFRVSHELHCVCPAYNVYFHINCTTFDRHTILSHELHNVWPAYNLYFHINYTTFVQHTIYTFTWIAHCMAGYNLHFHTNCTLFGRHTIHILPHELHGVWSAYNLSSHINYTVRGWCTIYLLTWITHHKKLPQCLFKIQNPVLLEEVALYRDA